MHTRRDIGILTIPNLLTFARLAALPFVIALSRAGHPTASAVVFLIAMLTDCFDGLLAKRLNQHSVFGLYLDPVVDKIVLLSLFYHLAFVDVLFPAVAHLFLVRELLQNGVRSVAAAHGDVVGANWMGKTKASLQTILIAWGLLIPAFATSPSTSEVIQAAFNVSAHLVLAVSWCFLAVFVHRNRLLLQGGSRDPDERSGGRH